MKKRRGKRKRGPGKERVGQGCQRWKMSYRVVRSYLESVDQRVTFIYVTHSGCDAVECVTAVDVRVFPFLTDDKTTPSPPDFPPLSHLFLPPLFVLSGLWSLYTVAMYQALPYRTWVPTAAAGNSATGLSERSDGGPMNPGMGIKDVTCVKKMVSENAVIVFGRRGCCMCHVVRRLLLGLGVNPTVFEVDDDDEAAVVDELSRVIAGEDGKEGRPQFPAVFMGGQLFGGLERVMATHISGELVPILKKAGALWL